MKRYKIIYADPPWKYERPRVRGSVEKLYPTMSVDEVYRLPVTKISDDDSVLFLWTTFPKLSEALKVIVSWESSYKSGAGWFYSLGFLIRKNVEIGLLATKGKPKRQSNKVHQFILSPLKEHSQKPDQIRDKIIELVGDLPRIELFTRKKTDGWAVWGNEVVCDIDIAEYDLAVGGVET